MCFSVVHMGSGAVAQSLDAKNSLDEVFAPYGVV